MVPGSVPERAKMSDSARDAKLPGAPDRDRGSVLDGCRAVVHNVDMPYVFFALQMPPAPDARGLWRRFQDRGLTNLSVPSFSTTPYGKLSSGLFWEALRSRRDHKTLARLWRAFHYVIGILGIILAAFAGFGSLGKLLGDRQAAFIAIGAAIATGLITFLNSEEKGRQHYELAAAWDNLATDVSTLYEKRPDNNGVQQGADPDDWKTAIDPLVERAESLRREKSTLGSLAV